ncbi:hypothetical protein J6590_036011 [Homalodisca vitripennis]|nr:hypothetical protein J6590_036011 [Homalodisca vitripennis]
MLQKPGQTLRLHNEIILSHKYSKTKPAYLQLPSVIVIDSQPIEIAGLCCWPCDKYNQLTGQLSRDPGSASGTICSQHSLIGSHSVTVSPTPLHDPRVFCAVPYPFSYSSAGTHNGGRMWLALPVLNHYTPPRVHAGNKTVYDAEAPFIDLVRYPPLSTARSIYYVRRAACPATNIEITTTKRSKSVEWIAIIVGCLAKKLETWVPGILDCKKFDLAGLPLIKVIDLG